MGLDSLRSLFNRWQRQMNETLCNASKALQAINETDKISVEIAIEESFVKENEQLEQEKNVAS